MDVAPDGTIFVITRTAHVVPEVHPTEPILEDFIETMSPEGHSLGRFSVLDSVLRSDYAALMSRAPESGDMLHTNSLRILDGRLAGRIPAFAAGNILVSIPRLDVVAVIDPGTRCVVWALAGMTRLQHDPALLENGNLLVFDNRDHEQGSRVIEVDPTTQEVVWRYPSADDSALFSYCCGTAQRLANDNTLITMSGPGQVLEVTLAGEVVWQYDSPHRAGQQGELIATLMEMQRFDRQYVSSWLGESRK
jgi:hypothetical protein